jgi:DNA-binding beta-propeller fold protein YncE
MQGRSVSISSVFVGRRPRRWLHVLLLVGMAVAVTFPATEAAARLLGIAQLPGGQACIAQPDEESEAIGKCAKGGRGLLDANEVSVSPDGRSVYVAGPGSDAVAAFGRDVESGRITERNCVSANGTNGYDGTSGQCADGDALTGASSTTVSPDGKFVYVTSSESDGIAIFTRNQTTGSLKQSGCVRAVRTCTPARALGGASSIAITPDGKNAYVAAAESDAVAEFARNPDTGALSFIGCISDDGMDRTCAKGNALRGPLAVVASPDGKHVYVAAAYSDSVLTFRRDSQSGLLTQTGCVMDSAPRPGSCVRGRAMGGVVALTLTRDGRTLFAAASDSNALVVFSRNPVGGTIKEVGCVSEPYDEYENEDGQARNDGCTHYRPMGYPSGVAVTPDGNKVYVSVDSGLTAFERDRVTGGLKPIGCLTYADTWDEDLLRKCGLASGVADASDVAVSPDSRNVYVTSWASDAVAVFGPGVSFGPVGQASGAGTLSVHVACPRLHGTSCSGLITVTIARTPRLLASASYRLDPGRWGVVHVRLGRSLRHALAKRGVLRGVVAASDKAGVTGTFSRAVVLRRAIRARPSR